MIFEHINSYKLSEKVIKIQFFCPAYDDSLVLLALQGPGQDALLHYDKNGNLKFKFNKFNSIQSKKDFSNTLCMPND